MLLISSLIMIFQKSLSLLPNVSLISYLNITHLVDGVHPSMAAAINGGKIMIHSPFATNA